MNLGILKEGLKMDKTPLISVIVPVYNTGKYLKECLDSLRLQTYNNLEFICVDDGSTDNSLEILKNYAAQDKRFIILSLSARLHPTVRHAVRSKARILFI